MIQNCFYLNESIESYTKKRDQDRNDNPNTTILEILAPLPNKNIKEFEDFFDRPPNEKET